MEGNLILYTLVLLVASFAIAAITTTRLKYRERILIVVGIAIAVGAVLPTRAYVDRVSAKTDNVVKVTASRYFFKVEGKARVGEPTLLTVTSTDYQHSVYNRELAVNLQAIPGEYNSITFVAKRPGIYPLRCIEYCGEGHSGMEGTLEVLPADASAAVAPATASTLDGEALYAAKGCAGCHTIGKGQLVGPDLAGIGARRDEAYLTRWLADPEQVYKEVGKRPINAGMPTTMPNLGLSADEVKALVAFLGSKK